MGLNKLNFKFEFDYGVFDRVYLFELSKKEEEIANKLIEIGHWNTYTSMIENSLYNKIYEENKKLAERFEEGEHFYKLMSLDHRIAILMNKHFQTRKVANLTFKQVLSFEKKLKEKNT